jgi:hypothetical protein
MTDDYEENFKIDLEANHAIFINFFKNCTLTEPTISATLWTKHVKRFHHDSAGYYIRRYNNKGVATVLLSRGSHKHTKSNTLEKISIDTSNWILNSTTLKFFYKLTFGVWARGGGCGNIETKCELLKNIITALSGDFTFSVPLLERRYTNICYK